MVIEDGITEELERIKRELERLGRMKITVGIQGVAGENTEGKNVAATADIMTIAGVHEFGATIRAKNVKNLAIPIAKKAVGKSPLDFDDLFFIRSKEGVLFGCISDNIETTNPRMPSKPTNKKPQAKKPQNNLQIPQSDEGIEYLFILFESVEIPERSFIRAGYDSNKDTISDSIADVYKKITYEGWDAETAANHVGMVARDCIVEYMMDSNNFKTKGSIARSTSNWPDNPLIETGRLRNSITYIITEG